MSVPGSLDRVACDDPRQQTRTEGNSVSIRTWEVPASAQITIGEQDYPIVTQDDLIKAMVDAAVVVDRAGGCIALTVMRVPTGVPNEMLTTRALVSWQDRTNAKPQPEPSALTQPAEDLTETEAAHHAAVDAQDATASPDTFDDGLHVDPDAVDESDPGLQAAIRG